MSHAIETHRQGYLALMGEFVFGALSGAAFQRDFLQRRSADIDSDLQRRAAWPRPFDEELREAYSRREITDREFQRQWADLWGYDPHSSWLSLFEELFGAVNDFVADPVLHSTLSAESPGEFLDEEELRDRVRLLQARATH